MTMTEYAKAKANTDYTKTLVLFSGGMDSTVALYFELHRALKQGGVVHALAINYGQRHHAEIDAASTIIKHVMMDPMYRGVMGRYAVHAQHMPTGMPNSLLSSSPVTKYKDLYHAELEGDEDTSFIPYRNMLFMTIAAQYAYTWGAGTITTGLRGGWPDCTAEFEGRVRMLLNLSNPSHHFRIGTPTHRTREDTLLMAKSIPGCFASLEYTVTCFEGTRPPCGRCLPCLKRAEGFRAIGATDRVYSQR